MAQDAVQADPKHYKVELENDQVRVIRMSFGPREKSVMHEALPGVVVFLTDCNFNFTDPDGRTANIQGKAGQVLWAAGRRVNLPENLSDTSFEAIYIESKT
jgi:hypothetical protein